MEWAVTNIIYSIKLKTHTLYTNLNYIIQHISVTTLAAKVSWYLMGILRIDVMSVVPVKQDMLSTAAYLETIKTGCQQSPCATSKFCYYHAPRVSHGTDERNGSNVHAETRIVQIITGVRETRSGKCYEVDNYFY
jgi:PhoPQ-activated pathogenicity-related protein